MLYLGIGLLLWLVVSMLTMGVVCFTAAILFWAIPNQSTHSFMWFWYVHWTKMLGWWVKKLLPDMTVVNRDEIPTNKPFVIVANHYSWVDIVVLYATLFAENHSFVFVMKRSLIKIPMIGVVCWGLGHPLLYRGKSRRKNLKILTEGARKSLEYQHGILIFPEGTRYTKVDNYPEEYQQLLKPRTVGFECVLKNIVGDPSEGKNDAVPVLDVTLKYTSGEHGLWDFLTGKSGSVLLYSELHSVTPKNAKAWLLDAWTKKDHLLSSTQFPVVKTD
ncbi:MAG: 1-acyl-sn-glycerol-3-phosphate acyltransferase [Pseudomonadota bacterium]|nr:1-acyl-sn-glycerol-3-phosphate acyltransferase [Pseudomonadota bacterium]